MNTELLKLQPEKLWFFFESINQIPRGSKKEEAIQNWLIQFAQDRNLEYRQDKIGNVVICKPATAGYENRKTLVLQSHTDMVHQKNNDTDFNFDTDPIQSEIRDGWLYAKGTTLGADNGIGCATMLATLDASDMEHPAIEALFTVDEETGMTGAIELDGSIVTGDYLLNLDTEEDTDLTIGCAGGSDFMATKSLTSEPIAAGKTVYSISIKGLQGGHSGSEIHLGLGNANILLARFLYNLDKDLQLISFSGGNLRNVIPREAFCEIATGLPIDTILKSIDIYLKDLKAEYEPMEKNITMHVEKNDHDQALSTAESRTIIQTIVGTPNGVFRWSNTLDNLVETSGNLASTKIDTQHATVWGLLRSSVESSKDHYKMNFGSIYELAGFDVTFSGEYPGWEPKPSSTLVTTAAQVYQDTFGEKMHVNAIHAGLECGLLLNKCPQMEAISFGPNIYGAHSPDERCEIKSVQKYWTYYRKLIQSLD